MDRWRIGRFLILAGGIGLFIGSVLAGVDEDAHRGQSLDAIDPLGESNEGALTLSLLVLFLAAWNLWAWGLGKLVVLGLMAFGGVVFTLVDFAHETREPLWSQGYEGVELVARWVVAASSAVVFVGVLWSLAEGLRRPREGQRPDDHPARGVDQQSRPPRRRSQDMAASVAWWRRWGMPVVGLAVAFGIGWLLYAGREDQDAPIDIADEGDGGSVQDEWSIAPDGDSAGSYIFSMIKTFRPLDEADVEDMGGRLVWPETEIVLCDVNIYSAGDQSVQIGTVSPTTEGCPGVHPAFLDFGLPQTACLFVRVGGIDDEHCAPLTVGTAETESEP